MVKFKSRESFRNFDFLFLGYSMLNVDVLSTYLVYRAQMVQMSDRDFLPLILSRGAWVEETNASLAIQQPR